MRASWDTWQRTYWAAQENAQLSSRAACWVGERLSQTSSVTVGTSRGGHGNIDRAGGGVSGLGLSITRGAGGGTLVQAHSVVIAAAVSADFNRLGTEVLQFAEGFIEAVGKCLVRLEGGCPTILEEAGVLFGDIFEASELGVTLLEGGG